MIIKSSRVLAHHGAQISQYLDDQGENELVSWALGDATDIELMSLIARYSGKLFGVRHIVIAAERDLPISELQAVVADIFDEYGVSDLCRNQTCLVMHKKLRGGAGEATSHFHMAIPEFDPASGRVLCSRFTKMRDEKLARIFELKHGHPCLVGRFNSTVYNAIAQEQPDLDLQPFEDALRQAAIRQGRSEEDWKAVKAFASGSSLLATPDGGSELDLSTPSFC